MMTRKPRLVFSLFSIGPMLSHVPKAKGVDKKTGIEGAPYFLGSCFFWGGIEIVFLFIVVPCRPKSQKPRDVDKKTPSWVFFVWTELGIFGAAEYFRVGWRKFSHL